MKKFVNLLRREQGLTLIELIAAITIFAMVSGLIYAVMMFGMRSFNQVTTENKLRDEGDLLMSAVINEMYTFGAETVTASAYEVNSNQEIISSSIKLQRDGTGGAWETISIKDEKLSIVRSDDTNADSMTSVTSRLTPGSSIVLQCGNTGSCSSGLIHINLNLLKTYGGKDYTLTLESTFGF
ncbi:prepilin-type N-terminal cleavage/methylation domain-containing protein [Paenibacillus sp. DMB5]|uniref:PulJ/GspJ family protein n=1 Tax=Paenibacillus sp. DMB5 TaxID=1780103 RepID=UPI00076CD320|nr:prepilin-type N-terminal cleavage/methylation domain-containing protein [Paenibacillus sp. DMB5]KUP23890.1 hypothetical protein AWJ19_12105 [Paenibacillus sp. DMB5]